MDYYITNFSNIKKLDENCIVISTCAFDPAFFHSKTNKWARKEGYYVNENNILLGIREELLSPLKLDSSDVCQKDCQYKESVPDCPFLVKYREYLDTIDFDYLLAEFKRLAGEVKKITSYKKEPKIVLLVYEAVDNKCSERVPLQELFKKHGLELKNIEEENKTETLFF